MTNAFGAAKIDPLSIVRPVWMVRLPHIGFQFVRDTIRYIRRVHARKTAEFCHHERNFLRIRRPARETGWPFVRNLNEIAAIGVGHPNAPGSRASRIEGHMFAVGRILAVVLLPGGHQHLHRRSFGMFQVFSPDVHAVVGQAEGQFVPIARNRWPISCCDRQFVHLAIAHADYIEFVALCIGPCHNQRLIIAAPS